MFLEGVGVGVKAGVVSDGEWEFGGRIVDIALRVEG